MSIWTRLSSPFRNSFGFNKKPIQVSSRPQLVQLEERAVPTASLVFYPDSGSPSHIRIFNPSDLSTHKDFYAFDKSYTGGVKTSSITFNNREYIAVSALQNTHIKIFDITTNPQEVASYYAFKGYRGEIDIKMIQNNSGNGIDLIATPKNGPCNIKIIDGLTGTMKDQFYAYNFAKTTSIGIQIAPCGSTINPSLIITPHGSGLPIIIKDLTSGTTKQLALPTGFKSSIEKICDPDNNGKYILRIDGYHKKVSNFNSGPLLINLESFKYVNNNGVYLGNQIVSTIASSYSSNDLGNGNESITSSSGQVQTLRPFGGYAGKIFTGSSFETFDNWAKFSSSFTTTELSKIGNIKSKFIKTSNGYSLTNDNGTTFVNQNGLTNSIVGSFNNLWKVNSDIGMPLTEAQITDTKDHWFQRFENGILSGPTDYALYAVKGDVFKSWKKLFEAGYEIGIPTSITYGSDTKLQQFENGSISVSNSGDTMFYQGYSISDLSNLPDQDVTIFSSDTYAPIRSIGSFDTGDPALKLWNPVKSVINGATHILENPLGAIRDGLREASDIWGRVSDALGLPTFSDIFHQTYRVHAPVGTTSTTTSSNPFLKVLISDINPNFINNSYKIVNKTYANLSISGHATIDGTNKEYPNYDNTKIGFWDTRLNTSKTTDFFSNWGGLPENITDDKVVTVEEAANLILSIQKTLKSIAIHGDGLLDKDPNTYLSFLYQPITQSPWVFAMTESSGINGAGGLNHGSYTNVRQIVHLNQTVLESGQASLIELDIGTKNINLLVHEMGHSMGMDAYFHQSSGSTTYNSLKSIWDRFANLSQHSKPHKNADGSPSSPLVDDYYMSHWQDFAGGFFDLRKPLINTGAAYGYGSVNEDFAEFIAEIYRHRADFSSYYSSSSSTKKQKIDCVLKMIDLEYPSSYGYTEKDNIPVYSKYSIVNPNDHLPS